MLLKFISAVIDVLVLACVAFGVFALSGSATASIIATAIIGAYAAWCYTDGFIRAKRVFKRTDTKSKE